MASVWHALDRRLGVPVVFALCDNEVATNAPQVAVQRRERYLTTATSDLVDGLGQCFHLHAECGHDGRATVDLTEGDAWLGALPIDTHALSRSANAISAPTLRTRSGIVRWDEAVATIGTDAATWVALRSASKAPPYVLGLELVALRGRTDVNPLALVRRAHAACVIRDRSQMIRDEACAETNESAEPAALSEAPEQANPDDGSLRFAILAASRALHDIDAAGRSRPAMLAVEHLGREALRHVERAPVTRTDLPALAVARSILRASLDAVGVSAPVPY